ncbi:DEAD/DEAH box helicase [Sulfobacillus thermosulfidooxidans]|uniref:DEAD/DEAH box helicase n=1 Tax=Sulfobacillus thermosulfidooxidans TaxID=28034 RepID=UPI0006B65120|nr:DEAD/DEAH box helicase [Sulfobacillus thermosulfidooxidans]
MPLQLRPYQTEAVHAIQSAVRQGFRRVLAVLPTGAGKTVIAADLARQSRGRLLFLVNRDELVQQSVAKLHLTVPAADIGIVQGPRREWHRRYVVASVQTVSRSLAQEGLLTQDATDPFRLVIVDEAHHIGAATYQQLWHRLVTQTDRRVLLGITATPLRTDGKKLTDFFDTTAYRLDLPTLIQQGYLVPVRGYRIVTPTVLRHVRTHHGDFSEKDLALAVDTPERNKIIVDSWRQYAEDRQTVVFAVNVAHARHLAETFAAQGIATDWIDGSLSLTERRRRLAAFSNGTLRVLTNCAVLTEGWDEPQVSCLVMARPTASRGLYIQMAGRGLRPSPGKTDCLILDVTDKSHTLTYDVTALTVPDEDERKPRKARTPREPSAVHDDPADWTPGVQPIPLPWDALGHSPFVWHADAAGPWLEAGPRDRICLTPTEDGWRVTWVSPEGSQSLHEAPVPLPYAQGIAEDWVRAQNRTAFAAKDAPWRRRLVSAKQQDLLRRLHIPFDPGVLTQEEASRLIHEAMDRQPLTPKQHRWLVAHHIPIPPQCIMRQAAQLIAAAQPAATTSAASMASDSSERT